MYTLICIPMRTITSNHENTLTQLHMSESMLYTHPLIATKIIHIHIYVFERTWSSNKVALLIEGIHLIIVLLHLLVYLQ